MCCIVQLRMPSRHNLTLWPTFDDVHRFLPSLPAFRDAAFIGALRTVADLDADIDVFND